MFSALHHMLHAGAPGTWCNQNGNWLSSWCCDVLPVGLTEARSGYSGIGSVSFAVLEMPALLAARTAVCQGGALLPPCLHCRRCQVAPLPVLEIINLFGVVRQVVPSCWVLDMHFGWHCDGWHVGSATSRLSRWGDAVWKETISHTTQGHTGIVQTCCTSLRAFTENWEWNFVWMQT